MKIHAANILRMILLLRLLTNYTVQALNRVFQQWNLTAPPKEWNISGEPCSGFAISRTRIDDMGYWPGIKCDCSYSDRFCHITQL